MILDVETRYLSFDATSLYLEGEVQSTAAITSSKPYENRSDIYSIKWDFNFYIDGRKLYSEQSETQFIFQHCNINSDTYENLDRDYLDLKKVIFECALDLRNNLLNKDERLIFPEVQVDKLACEMLQKIILDS